MARHQIVFAALFAIVASVLYSFVRSESPNKPSSLPNATEEMRLPAAQPVPSTDDSLLSDIQKELHAPREPLVPDSLMVPTPQAATATSPAICNEDRTWLAAELILKAARLLEADARRFEARGENALAEARRMNSATLRQQVFELVTTLRK
jgi:hypothetical protein